MPKKTVKLNKNTSKLGIYDKDTKEFIGDYKPKQKRYIQSEIQDEELINKFVLLFTSKKNLQNEILKRMNNFNKVHLSLGILTKISKQYECNLSSIYRAIDKMIDDDNAIRLGRGKLFINPEFAIRGQISKREELMFSYLRAKTEILQKPKKVKQPKLLPYRKAIND